MQGRDRLVASAAISCMTSIRSQAREHIQGIEELPLMRNVVRVGICPIVVGKRYGTFGYVKLLQRVSFLIHPAYNDSLHVRHPSPRIAIYALPPTRPLPSPSQRLKSTPIPRCHHIHQLTVLERRTNAGRVPIDERGGKVVGRAEEERCAV